VDLKDSHLLSLHWGLTAEQYDIAPVGGDGVVDILDFQEMAAQWLSECN
jgi:hypothetical protein